jgi:poly(3-hydroxybutyrate) depolymerase
MNYYAYEWAHAVLSPLRFGAEALKASVNFPFNPMSTTPFARSLSAACEVFENVTRRYGKPVFGITETQISALTVTVAEEVVLSKPFCNLLHFQRDENVLGKRHDPKVLIVAPMSGHYASLLRGTVKAMLP